MALLEALYNSWFRPELGRPTMPVAVASLGLVCLVLSLNAVAFLGGTALDWLGWFFLFGLGLALGWFWLSAALHTVALWLGGVGSVADTFAAVAQSLWPLLLTGAANSALNLSPSLGLLFSLAINAGVVVNLVRAVGREHQLPGLRAVVCFGGAIVLVELALLGLILWPLMVLLGM
ncbi:MAG: Yip1 family protein [Gloeomargarita sp. SKYBB_i_bin120]|nr:YIP1 family protein [Gloeomargarita sp. SKYG98]MCS7293522.1 YIP1 family protein [Gloeomargarita sp. SKYB120]MDW8179088.1 Yip1 family protein [Gloeomargarita sp. SKYBB_i_bin120]